MMDPVTEVNRHTKALHNMNNKVDAYLSNDPQPDLKAEDSLGLVAGKNGDTKQDQNLEAHIKQEQNLEVDVKQEPIQIRKSFTFIDAKCKDTYIIPAQNSEKSKCQSWRRLHS